MKLFLEELSEINIIHLPHFNQFYSPNSTKSYKRSVFDLETIPIFHPHYYTHSGNTSRSVNLAVVRWLVSYEDENEYDNDNGNEIED